MDTNKTKQKEDHQVVIDKLHNVVLNNAEIISLKEKVTSLERRLGQVQTSSNYKIKALTEELEHYRTANQSLDRAISWSTKERLDLMQKNTILKVTNDMLEIRNLYLHISLDKILNMQRGRAEVAYLRAEVAKDRAEVTKGRAEVAYLRAELAKDRAELEAKVGKRPKKKIKLETNDSPPNPTINAISPNVEVLSDKQKVAEISKAGGEGSSR